jgi:histidine triad (HIT) family protein
MDCIFCDIVNKKECAEILYENDSIISFLDIRPVNFGHALVIPKIHYENFLSVPNEKLDELIEITRYLSKFIKEGLKADGFNIIVNNGAAAGQTIYHFHFHIIPRFEKDFNFKPNFKMYAHGKMKEYADIIRDILKKESQNNGKQN